MEDYTSVKPSPKPVPASAASMVSGKLIDIWLYC